jgi:hypothetical protein
MAETKSPGGTGGGGGTGGTGGSGAGGSGQKTLEMRVAELEDRLSKLSATEGQGGATQCGVACGVARMCVTDCVQNCVANCIHTCVVDPCIQQCVHHCVANCIHTCVVDPCIQQCVHHCIRTCEAGPPACVLTQQSAAAAPPCVAAQGVRQSCIAQQGVQSCIAQQSISPIYRCIRCIIRCIINDPIIFNPGECLAECSSGGGPLGGGGFGSFGM